MKPQHSLYWEKYKKVIKKITDLKYQLRYGMTSLNYPMDHILYQIFKITSNLHGEKAGNPSIRIYVNKIENRITFKIKTEYYL